MAVWPALSETSHICRDEEELRRSLSELADPNPKVIKRVSGGSGSSSSPFLDLTPGPGAAVYKHGALVRKVHADPDCRKSMWLCRDWGMDGSGPSSGHPDLPSLPSTSWQAGLEELPRDPQGHDPLPAEGAGPGVGGGAGSAEGIRWLEMAGPGLEQDEMGTPIGGVSAREGSF